MKASANYILESELSDNMMAHLDAMPLLKQHIIGAMIEYANAYHKVMIEDKHDYDVFGYIKAIKDDVVIQIPSNKEEGVTQNVKIQYLTVDEMINRFGDSLTEDQKKQLREIYPSYVKSSIWLLDRSDLPTSPTT